MIGDESIGYMSRDTNHFPSHHHIDNGISNGGSLGVSAGDVRRGFRSQYTIDFSSCNCGVYRHGDKSGDDVG